MTKYDHFNRNKTFLFYPLKYQINPLNIVPISTFKPVFRYNRYL